MNDVLAIFSDRLKELINEKYNSVKEFAVEIKIPYSTINSWILKKRQPTILYLRKLAEHFKVSADYLIGMEN